MMNLPRRKRANAFAARYQTPLRMKNAFNLLLFFFMAGIFCGGCAGRRDKGLTIMEGTLSVGVEAGYPPMEYFDVDGETLIGFDIELAEALAGKLGLNVKFIDTGWDGIMAGLDTGRYDIAINITILPGRQKRYNFTKPYIDSSMTIVVRKDSVLKVEKPEDIAGRGVAYQGGTTAQYFAEKLSGGGVNFTAFSYDKILNCFDDLEAGRVDLVVVDSIAAYHYAGKENVPFEVVWRGPSDEAIGICLKKGNDSLTIALDNALDELFDDGTLLEISQKIFNRDMVSSVR